MYNKIVIYLQRNSGYDMKWSELRRIAERKGWFLLKNGKKHDIYKHPDSLDRIEIGRHGKEEIPYGTFCKLKKQIGF